ncbi:MAG: sulfotransferase [Rhodanobacter sp.]|jgi:tetratricopeptide (TPR) repeat protein|nr:sulfotransferase [Rhodanobacter sp.]
MNADSNTAAESRLWRRARHYLEANLLDAAQGTLETIVQRTPQDIRARLQLSAVLLKRGKLRDSNEALLQIAKACPKDVQWVDELVRSLYFTGEIVAARECVDQLDILPDLTGPELASQARLRWLLGEIPEAGRLIECAMAAGADSADDHYLRGLLLQFTGHIDQADKVFETSLQRWPNFADVAVLRSNLRRQTAQANHLDVLQEQLHRIPADSADPATRYARAGFEAALFKELDDLGRHDEAWGALERSNALLHALNPYDAAGQTAVVNALIDASRLISTHKPRAAPAFAGPIPIFIVSMPRSGSTLLDRMLSSHSQVTSAGELNDFLRQLRWTADASPLGVSGTVDAIQRSPNIDFGELGARYLKQTQWRAQGRRFYIDKAPINVRMVHFIHKALPHAPILYITRDPMDVCYSNFKAMFGNSSAYSYDMQTMAHYFGLHQRLTSHWRDNIPDALLEVSYASLMRDTEATLGKVLQHCGLDMEESCLHPERNADPVATPSSAQVREPIHTRSIGEWQHYAKQLEPLLRAIG